MPDEPVAVAEPVTPLPPLAPETSEAPVAEDAEVEEPATEDGGETPIVTWDSHVETLPTGLKTAWELKQEDLREEGRRDMQGKLQPRYVRMGQGIDTFNRTSQEIKTAVDDIKNTLIQAQQDGTLDGPAMIRLFNTYPQAFPSLNGLTDTLARFQLARDIANYFGDEIAGDSGKEFKADFTTRWDEATRGAEPFASVWTDMMTTRDEALKQKWQTPLKNRIKALETQMERGKAEARTTGGPSPSGGRGSGGGKGYPTRTAVHLAHASGELTNNQARQLLAEFDAADRNR